MKLRLKNLGLVSYAETWQAMREFTEQRNAESIDEIWLVEHEPVFTLGLNGDSRHILHDTSIPIIKTDRGGQVTYHGPGQLVVYVLFDIKRLAIGSRALVTGLENALIDTLGQYGVIAHSKREAPGVYVNDQKIASIGLRIRKGCSYHGLSLNVTVDLSSFSFINPCGYPGQPVTRLIDLGASITPLEASVPLVGFIMQQFGYNTLLG